MDISDGTSLEKSDKLLRRGFKNWEERCLVHGGREVLDEYLAEQENLIYCMMEQFDLEEIRSEVERKKKSGDLDEVFKKYCNENVPAARDCLSSFLSVSRNCLEERDQAGLNVTLQMVDSAIEFSCHRDGDRMALFLAEEGAECVASHYTEILGCVNKSVPEMLRSGHHQRQRSRMHFYVFQQENCRKGDAIMECVEESLLQCPDPSPANLVHGLLRAIKDVTPCTTSAARHRSVSAVLLVLAVMVSGKYTL